MREYRKFTRNLRDYGIAITLRKSLGRLFGFLYDSTVYRIYGMDLEKSRVAQRPDGAFTYRVIASSDTDCILQIEAMEEWLEGSLASKLAKGSLCLVAMDGNVVAGFNLVGFGEVHMPLVNGKRNFRNGSAWSEQITVNNKYRGKGLGSELRYRMFEELKRQGYKKFYGGTRSNNQANLKLTRKVGFKEIADIRYMKLLTMERWRLERVRNGNG
ncbi:MAG: N-acetyltransferase family protein [Candidatus Deferrimicrobiaceae bacterium]